MKDRNNFDPDDITLEDMKKLADNIEEYLDVFREVMIIPEEIRKKDDGKVEKAIEVIKKLIKKLRKGDKSVFKDSDEWNSIL